MRLQLTVNISDGERMATSEIAFEYEVFPVGAETLADIAYKLLPSAIYKAQQRFLGEPVKGGEKVE